MPVTRLGPGGYGVRRAGSFAGKTAAPSYGPHPVGVLTRFGMAGYGVRRAGDFSGKTEAAPTPAPALDYAPGGFYPEYHRHSKKLRKEIERAEQFVEDAPKVIAKAVERVRNAPEMAISEALVAQMSDALAQAQQIAHGIAGDLAALQRKQMADRETKRAIRAAKALLAEIEALERDDEEALTLLLAN